MLRDFNGAFWEVTNCRALHEATCVDLKKACQRTVELKRKAAEAHERTRSHRERCRRATKEHTKSEAAINHSFGCLGWFVKETTNATHSVTCGVPDGERNETKYLNEATELISAWQRQPQGVQSVSRLPASISKCFFFQCTSAVKYRDPVVYVILKERLLSFQFVGCQVFAVSNNAVLRAPTQIHR